MGIVISHCEVLDGLDVDFCDNGSPVIADTESGDGRVLHHVNLSTGNVAHRLRADIDDTIIDMLRPLVTDLITSDSDVLRTREVPGEAGFHVQCSREHGVLLFQIYGPAPVDIPKTMQEGPTPVAMPPDGIHVDPAGVDLTPDPTRRVAVASFGVGIEDGDDARAVWRCLWAFEYQEEEDLPDLPAVVPWCAGVVHPCIMLAPIAWTWMDDFQCAIAWTVWAMRHELASESGTKDVSSPDERMVKNEARKVTLAEAKAMASVTDGIAILFIDATGDDLTVTVPHGETGTVILRGPKNGTLNVIGAGTGNAVRVGDGNGDANRSGSGYGHAVHNGDGEGDAVRDGSGYGRAMRGGAGNGHALREGSGFGHAIHSGDGEGDANRDGSGGGDAYRRGEGDGNGIRHGGGNGFARREGGGDGDAWRTGHGDGHAIRQDAGDGDALREGDGDGDAVRSGAGNGGAFRSGDGDGDASREDGGNGNALREGNGAGSALCSGSGSGDAEKKGAGGGTAVYL